MVTYKKGSQGSVVKAIQRALNLDTQLDVNFKPLLVDGDYGDATVNAVSTFQRKNYLFVDGIAGPTTLRVLGVGSGKSMPAKKVLSEKAIRKAAKLLDVDTAAIKAIAKTESAGAGFFDDGTIKMLLERHHVRAYLTNHNLSLLEKWAKKEVPDVCSNKTGGYLSGKRENKRWEKVSKFSSEAAIFGTSYGKFQIMGFNYKACGCKTLGEFDERMRKSEDEQLMLFCNFIQSQKPLHRALKSHDWSKVARLYNGPNYRDNDYHTKMKTYYEQYSS